MADQHRRHQFRESPRRFRGAIPDFTLMMRLTKTAVALQFLLLAQGILSAAAPALDAFVVLAALAGAREMPGDVLFPIATPPRALGAASGCSSPGDDDRCETWVTAVPPLPPGARFSVNGQSDPSSSSPIAAFSEMESMPLGSAAGDWSIVSSPNTAATQSNTLLDVTCVSASDCWAVGYYFPATILQTLMEHWDGTSWAIVSSPNISPTQNHQLTAVTCASPSDCWAVGSYTVGTPPGEDPD